MLRPRVASTLALLTLAFALPTASLHSQDLPPAPRIVPEITLRGAQPGDRVTLTLYNQTGEKLTDIGGERIIDENGSIFLPFIEDFQILGMEQDEIRSRLDALYENFYANSVVEVTLEYRVSATGSVRLPGSFFMPPTATIVDLLSRAGGAGSEVDLGVQGGASDPSRAQLTRVGYEDPITLNLRPLEADPEILQAPIQSGDWIYIPPASRSQLREDILFVGSILTVLLGTASLIVLIADNSGG